MLTQETAKKPYGYQVNCHLKFGNSSHFKIKQTIKSEDKQESKKKQKKKKHNNKKNVFSVLRRKRVGVVMMIYCFLHHKQLPLQNKIKNLLLSSKIFE